MLIFQQRRYEVPRIQVDDEIRVLPLNSHHTIHLYIYYTTCTQKISHKNTLKSLLCVTLSVVL